MKKSVVVHRLRQGVTGKTDCEESTPLLAADGLRIEQIISHGQPSPQGFWYDQLDPEWVVLLAGSATLLIAEQGSVELGAGDYLLIPAHVRHRVERASEDALWLAVHFRQNPDEMS